MAHLCRLRNGSPVWIERWPARVFETLPVRGSRQMYFEGLLRCVPCEIEMV